MSLIYQPTRSQRLIASTIMVVGFALTLAVKIMHGQMEAGVSMAALSSLPNFICGAVLPFVVFVGNRTISYFDFLLFSTLIVISLIVYEVVQLVMPNRTFEANDIVASLLGGLLPVSLGWLFFRRNMGWPRDEQQSPPHPRERVTECESGTRRQD